MFAKCVLAALAGAAPWFGNESVASGAEARPGARAFLLTASAGLPVLVPLPVEGSPSAAGCVNAGTYNIVGGGVAYRTARAVRITVVNAGPDVVVVQNRAGASMTVLWLSKNRVGALPLVSALAPVVFSSGGNASGSYTFP